MRRFFGEWIDEQNVRAIQRAVKSRERAQEWLAEVNSMIEASEQIMFATTRSLAWLHTVREQVASRRRRGAIRVRYSGKLNTTYTDYDLVGRIRLIRDVERLLDERRQEVLERIISLRRRNDELYAHKDELTEVLERL